MQSSKVCAARPHHVNFLPYNQPGRGNGNSATSIIQIYTHSLVFQEKSFTSLGLTTLIINNQTIGEARLRGENLWLKARTDIAMILLSPEMLATKGYQTLMED